MALLKSSGEFCRGRRACLPAAIQHAATTCGAADNGCHHRDASGASFSTKPTDIILVPDAWISLNPGFVFYNHVPRKHSGLAQSTIPAKHKLASSGGSIGPEA